MGLKLFSASFSLRWVYGSIDFPGWASEGSVGWCEAVALYRENTPWSICWQVADLKSSFTLYLETDK